MFYCKLNTAAASGLHLKVVFEGLLPGFHCSQDLQDKCCLVNLLKYLYLFITKYL